MLAMESPQPRIHKYKVRIMKYLHEVARVEKSVYVHCKNCGVRVRLYYGSGVCKTCYEVLECHGRADVESRWVK